MVMAQRERMEEDGTQVPQEGGGGQMSENEILLRGIVVGASIVLPFLAMAIGRWLYWKRTTKFWLMMHRDLSVQNERLFEIIKQEHPFKEADDGND